MKVTFNKINLVIQQAWSHQMLISEQMIQLACIIQVDYDKYVIFQLLIFKASCIQQPFEEQAK